MLAGRSLHLLMAGAVSAMVSCLVYSDDLLRDGSPTGSGGEASTTSEGGSGGFDGGGGMAGGTSDLGWPLDDTLPDRCPAQPADGGSAWTGWGNLQFPAAIEVAAGDITPAIYGRTYQAGSTEGAGQAAGWQAELAVGPMGSPPEGEARCFSYTQAVFNVDVGNDDEYGVTLNPATPGLFEYYFRYRPPGGSWRYGDLNGSDDGVTADEAGRLVVTPTSTAPAPLVVATLNLGCRSADWVQRMHLVVEALARIDADLIGFQEDCSLVGDGPKQSEELRVALSSYTRRGYELRDIDTDIVEVGGQSYRNHLSILSAHPVVSDGWILLPHEALPAKALSVDVVVRGQPLRFYTTRFENAPNLLQIRQQAAQAIAANLPAGSLSIVAGDLGADPTEGVALTLASDLLRDAWVVANPSQEGATIPAPAPLQRVDYVLATKSLVEGALLGAKQLDASSGSLWLSDHRGVAVAFTVP